MGELLSFLTIIQHPIEGIAYLIYIALLLRWKSPNIWNKFLESIMAPTRTKPTT